MALTGTLVPWHSSLSRTGALYICFVAELAPHPPHLLRSVDAVVSVVRFALEIGIDFWPMNEEVFRPTTPPPHVAYCSGEEGKPNTCWFVFAVTSDMRGQLGVAGLCRAGPHNKTSADGQIPLFYGTATVTCSVQERKIVTTSHLAPTQTTIQPQTNLNSKRLKLVATSRSRSTLQFVKIRAKKRVQSTFRPSRLWLCPRISFVPPPTFTHHKSKHKQTKMPSSNLPQLTRDEVVTKNVRGAKLISIENTIYDVSSFLSVHPGDALPFLRFIESGTFPDATNAFYGIHPDGASLLTKYAHFVKPVGEVVDSAAPGSKAPW